MLSALGLIAAGRRRDTARTVLLAGEQISAERVAAEVRELAERAAAGLEGAELEVVYELRYRGQAFELPIPGAPEPDPAELRRDFAREHEARYGYRDAEARARARQHPRRSSGPGTGAPPGGGGRRGLRAGGPPGAYSAANWLETTVLRGEPAAGFEAAGPCVFELPEATLVLPPGWRARVDEAGTIVAEREAEGS